MALKTVNVCDRCGRECPYESIRYNERPVQQPGQHEGRTFPMFDSLDLCPMCMRGAVEELLAGSAEWGPWGGMETKAAFVKKVTTMPPPVRV
jgi:ferredoxin